MSRVVRLIFCLICVLILAGRALAGDVRLSAAASLRDVISELSQSYATKNPGVKFIMNYGASGTLAKQIENGAPTDIFISANSEWTDYLKKKKLVDASNSDIFAFNTLVFVGATGKRASGMQDLAGLDKIAIGSPKSVPAGEYAMAAIKRVGLDRRLEKKLLMARDVRDCLMYAERGEVDGSFVYRTDALRAKRARILFSVPQDLYPRVTYPMSLTLSGTKNVEARAFLAFLRSENARSVLVRYGFAVH